MRMKRAFDKITAGLREAIAGKFARGTVYRVEGGKVMPAQRYTDCDRCGNVTLTVKGRCDKCRHRKLDLKTRERAQRGDVQ